MPLKPLFGTLNARVSKTLVANAPKYRKIVEPFGDGGTWALELKKKRPKEHLLNIVDPDLFAAMTFVQNPSGADKARLKGFNWVGSQETFDKVMALTATEGPEHFYKFFYAKKFGMSMKPGEPVTFDILSEGRDISGLLFGLPLMKVGLKGVDIRNGDPFTLLNPAGGTDTFLILLPKSQEDVEAVRLRLKGLSASVFFAAKVPGVEEALEWAKVFPEQISVISAPSIMMAKLAVMTNYENDLVPLKPGQGMGMGKAANRPSSRWRRIYHDERAMRGAAARTPGKTLPAERERLRQEMEEAWARRLKAEAKRLVRFLGEAEEE